jgi:hypothetical protein
MVHLCIKVSLWKDKCALVRTLFYNLDEDCARVCLLDTSMVMLGFDMMTMLM